MKGERGEEKHYPNMFTNMRQRETFPPPHHPHSLHPHSQTSEEANSQRSPSTTPTPSGAATIEVVRRPRGRPPGSKNKPKPPVIITRHSEPPMSPYVLEISAGADLIEAIHRFSRKRNLGICVLSASGTVANVTMRQPSATPGATVIFHGRFDLLSLSATVMPEMTSIPLGNEFAISLAGPQGQIVGGTVVAPLYAASTVYVIAASFTNPSYHRLPEEEEGRNSGENEGNSPPHPTVHGGGDGGGHPPPHPAAESCGMSFYSGHLGSDVIWAPTARQPPPHY